MIHAASFLTCSGFYEKVKARVTSQFKSCHCNLLRGEEQRMCFYGGDKSPLEGFQMLITGTWRGAAQA